MKVRHPAPAKAKSSMLLDSGTTEWSLPLFPPLLFPPLLFPL